MPEATLSLEQDNVIRAELFFATYSLDPEQEQHHFSVVCVCPACGRTWGRRLLSGEKLSPRYAVEGWHCPDHGGSLATPDDYNVQLAPFLTPATLEFLCDEYFRTFGRVLHSRNFY